MQFVHILKLLNNLTLTKESKALEYKFRTHKGIPGNVVTLKLRQRTMFFFFIIVDYNIKPIHYKEDATRTLSLMVYMHGWFGWSMHEDEAGYL